MVNRGLRALGLLGAVAAVWLAAGGTAQAQRFHKIEGVRPELHMDLGPGIGTGFLLEIPVYPDGWLERSDMEDELDLAPAFDFFFYTFHHCHRGPHDPGFCDNNDDFDPAFGPSLSVQWNVYIGDKWSVFPVAGIAFMIIEDDWIYRHDPGEDNDYEFTVAPVIGVGGRWHFGDRGALVLRLGFPFGMQFGVAF